MLIAMRMFTTMRLTEDPAGLPYKLSSRQTKIQAVKQADKNTSRQTGQRMDVKSETFLH
jgi:hypothetical protein